MAYTKFRHKAALLLLGLILAIVAVEIVLRIGGQIYLAMQEQKNKLSLAKKVQYTVLCLGDSTTALDGENAYPSQLEEILNKEFHEKKFSAVNKGIPGANSRTILIGLRQNLKVYNPDMVIVMMGSNDELLELFLENNSFFELKNFVRKLRIYKLSELLIKAVKRKSFLKDLFLKRGYYYRELQYYPEAEEMFKKAIKLLPGDEKAYIELGESYDRQNKFSQAEMMYKKAIEIKPKSSEGYVALGRLYRCRFDRRIESEQLLKKALELDPTNVIPYTELGNLYIDLGRVAEAEAMYKKVPDIIPNNYTGYFQLFEFYDHQGCPDKADEMLKKVIEVGSANESAFSNLGKYFYEHGKNNFAEEMFKKAIELEPGNPLLNEAIGYVRLSEGKYAEAESNFNKAKPTKEHTDRITKSNYRKLISIILKRKIKLVCVQYPVRRLEDLKEITGPNKDIIFVDNEMIFKQAIKNGKYEDFFIDRFGGDFGHCTPKGNELLANNIAQAISKEFFNKKDVVNNNTSVQ